MMTRSGVVTQDSINSAKIAELEEQIKVMQEVSKKDKEELSGEIKQNADKILEEMQSLFAVVMMDKLNSTQLN